MHHFGGKQRLMVHGSEQSREMTKELFEIRLAGIYQRNSRKNCQQNLFHPSRILPMVISCMKLVPS